MAPQAIHSTPHINVFKYANVRQRRQTLYESISFFFANTLNLRFGCLRCAIEAHGGEVERV